VSLVCFRHPRAPLVSRTKPDGKDEANTVRSVIESIAGNAHVPSVQDLDYKIYYPRIETIIVSAVRCDVCAHPEEATELDSVFGCFCSRRGACSSPGWDRGQDARGSSTDEGTKLGSLSSSRPWRGTARPRRRN
jgi:hypothetical protein